MTMTDQTNQLDSNGVPTGLFTPGAFRDARQGVIAGIFIPVMVAIGQNWFNRTGDWKLATRKAVTLVVGWKVLAFTAIVWVLQFFTISFWRAAMEANPINANTGQPTFDSSDHRWLMVYSALILLTLVPALGVPYKRMVDRSLFKQRFVYRLMAPVDHVLRVVPFIVLVTTVLVPFFFYLATRT